MYVCGLWFISSIPPRENWMLQLSPGQNWIHYEAIIHFSSLTFIKVYLWNLPSKSRLACQPLYTQEKAGSSTISLQPTNFICCTNNDVEHNHSAFLQHLLPWAISLLQQILRIRIQRSTILDQLSRSFLFLFDFLPILHFSVGSELDCCFWSSFALGGSASREELLL